MKEKLAREYSTDACRFEKDDMACARCVRAVIVPAAEAGRTIKAVKLRNAVWKGRAWNTVSNVSNIPVKIRKRDDREIVITRRNRHKDMEKFRKMGAAAYREEQIARAECLRTLLGSYNDGRRKRQVC